MFLPTTFTFVGYHPTGMNPFDLLLDSTVTSNTARQLLSALAMYNVFSSSLKAIPLLVEPLGDLGNKEAFKVSRILLFFVLITETELSCELATNNKLPFLFNNNSFGWSPTSISDTIFSALIS